MHSSIQTLFEYSAHRLTDEDVYHCPVDPGYHKYVAAMKEIRDSREIPLEANFYITETIALTSFASGEEINDESFRRFRRFTNSVALGLEYRNSLRGESFGDVCDAYRLAYVFLVDTDESNREYNRLLVAAFEEVRNTCAANYWDIYEEPIPVSHVDFVYQYVDVAWIYFSFGMMYLSQLSEDWRGSEAFASQMIARINGEAGEYSAGSNLNENLGFMLERQEPAPEFSRLFRNWSSFFCRLDNPNGHKDTAMVIDALTQYSPKHH